MIGREDTVTLSTNHTRAFSHSFSTAETGFKSRVQLHQGSRPDLPVDPLRGRICHSTRRIKRIPLDTRPEGNTHVSMRWRAMGQADINVMS